MSGYAVQEIFGSRVAALPRLKGKPIQKLKTEYSPILPDLNLGVQ